MARPSWWVLPVHPRMRGEHDSIHTIPTKARGSSPHARGTQQPSHLKPGVRRFIPACAGNTSRRKPRRSARAVHPRMRGEHFRWFEERCGKRGSSPHARGTHRPAPGNPGGGRFIPACAGNTQFGTSKMPARPVHPRMRGEHRLLINGLCLIGGSSPHARGTLEGDLAAVVAGRFIPACAGNTVPGSGVPRIGTVHPRMRGEHGHFTGDSSLTLGSSPHARGTHHDASDEAVTDRFIPACAGNTQVH